LNKSLEVDESEKRVRELEAANRDLEARLAAAGSKAAPSPQVVAAPKAATPSDAGTVVLVLGAQSEAKESFGAMLAARLGGSVLEVQKLMESESAAGSEVGETILSYITEGKVVPPPLCLQLLERAKRDRPPPHILIDFPRVATLIDELEASLGAVQLALALSSDGNICGAFGKALGSKMHKLDAYQGDAALSSAEGAWRRV